MARRIKAVKALLEKYAAGDRAFNRASLPGANLRTANLTGARLRSADLGGADLKGAVLHGVNLSEANLAGANLAGAFVRDANLYRANLEGANLDRTKLPAADLTGARLVDATITGATLTGAALVGADLAGAHLRGANLTRASLHGASLRGANLSDANLGGANLNGAVLEDANLTSAFLGNANLAGARLAAANFAGAQFLGTFFVDIALGPLCNVETVHHGNSHVDFQSVVRSVREPRLKDFLRRTGMPDVFIEYMIDCARSLQPDQVFTLLQSTFISYGGPDEPFARKLNDALERAGVITFFFRDDAPPGEKIHRVMRTGVNTHDRVILICSESSLQRPGVLNELEETLAREARDGGNTYLIPVRVDDFVLTAWRPTNADVAQAVRDRVIADFENHADGDAFRRELGKLIAVLKRKPANAIVHT